MVEHFEAGFLGPQISSFIDSVLATDRSLPPELRRALLRGRRLLVADREVCRTFSLLARARGYPAGSQTIVLGFPNADDPNGVGVQHCSDDRITQIVITSDRADDDPEGATSDAERLVPVIHQRFRRSIGG